MVFLLVVLFRCVLIVALDFRLIQETLGETFFLLPLFWVYCHYILIYNFSVSGLEIVLSSVSVLGYVEISFVA